MKRFIWGDTRTMIQALLIALVCGACAGVSLFNPKPKHTHIFNHKLHTVDMKLDCVLCHYAVETNGVEQYGMLPQMADCLMCHQEKSDMGECAFCHTTLQPVPFEHIPIHTHVNYDHSQHDNLEGWSQDCLKCHSQAHEATHAGMPKLPRMQTCLECHQDWFDDLQCLQCHNGFENIPLKPLSEFSHAGNFTEAHGPAARGNAMLCAQCHEEQYCVDCHLLENVGLPADLKYPDITNRNWAHEGDFITRHSIEARFNSGQCVKCHSQNFCRDCHVKEGVADVVAGSRMDFAANPHPLGFGFREDPTDRNFHGRIARREIVSCAGCHDNGTDAICLECHSTIQKGGWGINPHPRGFANRLSRRKDRVCLACHVN